MFKWNTRTSVFLHRRNYRLPCLIINHEQTVNELLAIFKLPQLILLHQRLLTLNRLLHPKETGNIFPLLSVSSLQSLFLAEGLSHHLCIRLIHYINWLLFVIVLLLLCTSYYLVIKISGNLVKHLFNKIKIHLFSNGLTTVIYSLNNLDSQSFIALTILSLKYSKCETNNQIFCLTNMCVNYISAHVHLFMEE